MERRVILAWLAVTAASVANPAQAAAADESACSSRMHIDWAAEALKRMLAIRAGMTRKRLLEVFTTEGGLSTGVHRTYVSRDCPFFKVDVNFEPVDRPARDADGRVTLEEQDQDIIVGISRPYLQFTIAD